MAAKPICGQGNEQKHSRTSAYLAASTHQCFRFSNVPLGLVQCAQSCTVHLVSVAKFERNLLQSHYFKSRC